MWQMPISDGYGDPNRTAGEAVLQAKEDLPDWKILNTRRILHEEHNKMGYRQGEIRLWREG